MNIEDIKYEMYIGQFHTIKRIEDYKDVVLSIEYTYSGFYTVDGILYSHGITRSANVMKVVDDLNQDGFIDFNDITRETAMAWIMSSISDNDINQLKQLIRDKIEFDTMLSVRNAPWTVITEGQPSPNQNPIEK